MKVLDWRAPLVLSAALSCSYVERTQALEFDPPLQNRVKLFDEVKRASTIDVERQYPARLVDFSGDVGAIFHRGRKIAAKEVGFISTLFDRMSPDMENSIYNDGFARKDGMPDNGHQILNRRSGGFEIFVLPFHSNVEERQRYSGLISRSFTDIFELQNEFYDKTILLTNGIANGLQTKVQPGSLILHEEPLRVATLPHGGREQTVGNYEKTDCREEQRASEQRNRIVKSPIKDGLTLLAVLTVLGLCLGVALLAIVL